MTFVRCPQCDLPAEVTDRFSFASTGGPVEHLKITCAAGHWFTPRAADVEEIPVAAVRRKAA